MKTSNEFYKSSPEQALIIANMPECRSDLYPTILTVCSAGLLRSPTIAQYLNRNFNVHARAAGLTTNFSPFPINHAMCRWADHIVFVQFKLLGTFTTTMDVNSLYRDKCRCLDIPDDFDYGDPKLIEEIEFQISRNPQFDFLQDRKL